MNEFLVGLQFLTRISIVKQTVWTEESFGKSVKYFPAVGAVLGICYVIVTLLTNYLTFSLPMIKAAIILIMMAILTGAIHCDGFMDTMDGLFSGREREKMLEIMKDSRVGAFGVVSFVMITLFEFATLSELAANFLLNHLLLAVYAAPIIARLMMVVTIGIFPYARSKGMGKAFSDYTTKATIAFAAVETLILLILPLILFFTLILFKIVNADYITVFFDVFTIKPLIISLIAALIFTFYFGKFATKKIGGVTGDVYGAVTTLSEAIVFFIFLIF